MCKQQHAHRSAGRGLHTPLVHDDKLIIFPCCGKIFARFMRLAYKKSRHAMGLRQNLRFKPLHYHMPHACAGFLNTLLKAFWCLVCRTPRRTLAENRMSISGHSQVETRGKFVEEMGRVWTRVVLDICPYSHVAHTMPFPAFQNRYERFLGVARASNSIVIVARCFLFHDTSFLLGASSVSSVRCFPLAWHGTWFLKLESRTHTYKEFRMSKKANCASSQINLHPHGTELTIVLY